ncbi:hypothetical protein SLEP1_g41930 [Rubroshorea leprosula]|uniref:Protein MULTIPLE CHLOROPLAST DIVISION SITE 1 n=1 Tax=Rubroshorea leprosula TaxID=152421 RepID=A0AAV5L859_9ROSI|nr:hypothetical protein SLEP1_g41930 [Rubroshorea leprosula]
MKRYGGSNLVIGFCVATAILVLAVRAYVVRKSKHANPGSVADLVRRGHLRSDRRGISRPLKYDDPFNNPLVKSKGNSTVEMCGKVYRLAPITLTQEQQAIHQKRRSRAYQWKRPTVFLKEGDSVPPDVDPDTIRWIPANHPFATTVSDIDEDLAQNNVYQKHGVPFRIQAEHEALQRKLEALQNDENSEIQLLMVEMLKISRNHSSYIPSQMTLSKTAQLIIRLLTLSLPNQSTTNILLKALYLRRKCRNLEVHMAAAYCWYYLRFSNTIYL